MPAERPVTTRRRFPGSGPSLPAMPNLRPALAAALLVAIALLVTACDDGASESTTTTTTGTSTTGTEATTTTEAPITSIAPDAVPGTNSPSIPEDVAAGMRAQIGEIILDVEEARALPFLEVPTVTILDEAEFTQRVNTQFGEDIADEDLAGQQRMFTLLGMLDEDVDLEALLTDLLTEQVAGFYDPEAAEMVVPVSIDGITPLQEVVIAHELVHALTDQHFDFNDEYEARVDAGTGDDATGMLSLIEGDATYQQLLYLESMGPTDAAEAALEILGQDTSQLDAAPAWIQRDLAFPYEQGFVFTSFLVGQDGLAGLDDAYQDPPTTSEQILDPNKYLRGEGPADLAPLAVTLDGWELSEERTLGEWGIRLLLLETLSPGDLAQAAAGWGNDTYRFFTRGEDDAAFVWSYLGESVEDAEDLANALIALARGPMGASGGVESGGGLLFGEGSPTVFIDRIDDAIYLIAATDSAAVDEARAQLGI